MPLSQNDLDWYAARLSIAVYDTNQEYRMGIGDLRQQLAHIPGAHELTMQYGPHGTQIFAIGDVKVEVRPMATTAEIEAALLNPFQDIKKKLNPSHPSNPFSEAKI